MAILKSNPGALQPPSLFSNAVREATQYSDFMNNHYYVHPPLEGYNLETASINVE